MMREDAEKYVIVKDLERNEEAVLNSGESHATLVKRMLSVPRERVRY